MWRDESMAEFEREDGVTRDELIQRVTLMEAMIAEGRQYTGRNAWIFVLWGLVDLTAWAWQNYSPHFGGPWAWPICLAAGVVLTFGGKMMQKSNKGYSRNGEMQPRDGGVGHDGAGDGNLCGERDDDEL